MKGHVGVELPFQVVVKSLTHQQAKPLTMRRIEFFFSGGLRNIRILHRYASEQSSSRREPLLSIQHVITKLESEEDAESGGIIYNENDQEVKSAESEKSSLLHMPAGYLLGSADLSLPAGRTKAFSLHSLPREPGHIKLEKVILHIDVKTILMAVVISEHGQLQQDFLYFKQKGRIRKQNLANTTSTSMDILPKPPKLKLQIRDPPLMYSTSELMFCELTMTNDEEEEAKITLSITSKSVNGHDPLPGLSWQDESIAQDALQHVEPYIHRFLGIQQAGSVQKVGFQIAAPVTPSQCILDIEADYILGSDTDTHVQKLLSLDPDFIDPFNPTLEFSPTVHPTRWPSIFNAPRNDGFPSGLTQRWLLKANLNPSNPTLLAIEGVELIPSNTRQDMKTLIKELERSPELTEGDERIFQIDIQKLQLEDRRTSHLELELLINWRRKSQRSHDPNPISTMKVRAPRLALSFSEPRVLVAQQVDNTITKPIPDPNIIHLKYTLENPSLHLLTFTLTMEADEDFAFSGSKLTTTQLVPMSRHVVEYIILPLKRGKWINPVLKVVDLNFNQTLKVNATDGLRQDDKKAGGVLVWVDG